MRYQKRNKKEVFGILLLLFCLHAPIVWSQTANKKEGLLVGSVAYVDNGKAVAYPPGISVVLRRGSDEITIRSDENGDFNLKLAVGKYRPVMIRGADGRKLRSYGRLHGFQVVENRTTRWDLLLRCEK